MTVDSDRVRVSIIGVVVIAMFSALFARLWYLQVAAGSTYQAAAQHNSVRLVPQPPIRGRVLDRQRRPLVVNRIARVITVDRAITKKQRRVVVARLASLLGKTPAELNKKLDDPRSSVYAPVPIAVDVPIEVVTYVAEHAEDFPNVKAEAIAIREYPGGAVGAHLLGYVGEINAEELKAHAQGGYQLGDQIGKSGIEQAFEADLRGKPGIDKLEIDSAGHVLRSLGTQPPEPGHDVVLTVDLDVQQLAEESLQQGIDAARARFDKETRKNFLAPAGSVVVLDARDGSVVAMASNPTYNPVDFVNGISTDEWRQLTDPANHFPLTNRVIQGQYAPGSTFKLVSALASMQDGIISSGTLVDDSGSFTFAGQKFSNAGGAGNGRVNLPRAITVSSDVYFYKLGAEYWKRGGFAKPSAARDPIADGIQREARQLGFGSPTGIALTGEAVGRVPDEAWKQKFNENNPDPKSKRENSIWLPGDNIQLAVGQGDMLATPLQLANAYATFHNGGTVFDPRLATAVTNEDGDVVREVAPRMASRVPLDGGARLALLAGLRGVVTNSRGTAAPAFSGFPFDQVPVWGKTGTAQVGTKENPKQDTSLFVGMANVQQTPYVVVAVVEEAGRGAEVAAPIVRRIIEGLAGIAPTTVAAATSPTGGD